MNVALVALAVVLFFLVLFLISAVKVWPPADGTPVPSHVSSSARPVVTLAGAGIPTLLIGRRPASDHRTTALLAMTVGRQNCLSGKSPIAVQPPRDLRHAPLFQVSFAWEQFRRFSEGTGGAAPGQALHPAARFGFAQAQVADLAGISLHRT